MTTVLVVDDSVEDRLRVRLLIEACDGYDVIEAENGADALQQLDAISPDVIISDLHMPVMDGLQLVEEIRKGARLIPVVVITAHGNEQIAVQALQSGAAGYVPKAQLEWMLSSTVQQVCDLSRADRSHRCLMTSLVNYEAQFKLPNDTDLVSALVDHVQSIVTDMRVFDETERLRVAVAIEESLMNAIIHGNLELGSEDILNIRAQMVEGKRTLLAVRSQQEPYRERMVDLRLRVDNQVVSITIGDQGPGFDPSHIPDPTDPANLTRESGRGLLLVKMFMDEVTFNATGNQITLTKRRPNRNCVLGIPNEIDSVAAF